MAVLKITACLFYLVQCLLLKKEGGGKFLGSYNQFSRQKPPVNVVGRYNNFDYLGYLLQHHFFQSKGILNSLIVLFTFCSYLNPKGLCPGTVTHYLPCVLNYTQLPFYYISRACRYIAGQGNIGEF